VIDPGSDAEVAALLAMFFEQTSDFVGVADPWGGVLYLNPAAQKRLGIIEIEGVTLADLFPPEAFSLYYDVIRPALVRSGAWSGEILVNAAGSAPVPMRVSTVARIGPGGEVDGSVMVGHEPVESRPDRGEAAHATDATDATSASIEAFRLALSHGDVVPYAQPVVDLSSRLVMGYRGLARWNHRRLGQLPAQRFIDMVGGSSSASNLDLYVAREVAAMLLLTARFVSLRMYTPVSLRLIDDVHSERYLLEIAEEFSLPMHQMHLQIARPLLGRAPASFRSSLRSLRDAGVGFVLTGVEDPSEVEFAADNAFRELHLSRELTQAAAIHPGALRIVSDIGARAHRRGMLVAATGVFDRAHERELVDAGCDLGSGDVYGEPEPAAMIEEPAIFDDER
jgi:EAL domain-containing protein (putative c-di-GMP-specific phosphodiesterase class I)